MLLPACKRSDHEEKPQRQLGTAKGKIIMPDDFDEPLDDFSAYIPCIIKKLNEHGRQLC